MLQLLHLLLLFAGITPVSSLLLGTPFLRGISRCIGALALTFYFICDWGKETLTRQRDFSA